MLGMEVEMIYDYKTKNGGGLYAGSQIAEGVYVSARDVGNFAAGRAAAITGQDKMDFMLNAGGFNLSGNSKIGLILKIHTGKVKPKKRVFLRMERILTPIYFSV